MTDDELVATVLRDLARRLPAAVEELARHDAVGACAGSRRARMNADVAIGSLLRHAPNLRLAVAPHTLSWRMGLRLRALDRLPLKFTPRPGPGASSL
ncbi:hypothetical protein [Piscinibacter sp. XHJ-5]|uniref:hypothetical protein n=1 Tax=Piscinibacter sp. XHJ-5 TaxID=3037797 RepID=UPI00245350E2|nr:hypothetical protein [Piscinibacter sp. XHJ-5]